MNWEICSERSTDVMQVLALVIAAGWALFLFRKSQQLQRAQIYKDMEFKAIDLFVMAVHEPVLNGIYETDPEKVAALSDQDRSRLRDYAYCVLNLFELMCNLQERRLITEGIFSTWASWYYEFSRGTFCRNLWKEEAARHYSSNFGGAMSKMMDEVHSLDEVYPMLAGIRITKRGHARGTASAGAHAKSLVNSWRQMVSRMVREPAQRSGRGEPLPSRAGAPSASLGEPRLGWAAPGRAAAEYVDFFLRNTDPSFISFGEIIDGRADGPAQWSSRLRVVLTREIEEALAANPASGEYTRLFDARGEDGSLLGYALVAIDKASHQPNAWLADVIVDARLRGRTLGATLVGAIESELARDGSLRHIFLESSAAKPDAHRFFGRLGYREVAIVMMKSLR